MYRTKLLLFATVTAVTLAVLTPPASAVTCVTDMLCEEPEPAPATTTTTTAPPPPARTMSPAEATDVILRRLNQERASRNLPLFERRGDVDDVAQSWSHHLAEQGSLSHNDAYFTTESRQRLGARALGENVAVNQSPDAAHDALMRSEHHRANILDGRFTVVGLGAEFRNGGWWITQDFLQPRAVAAPAPAPAAPAPRATAPVATAAPAAVKAAPVTSTTAAPPPAPGDVRLPTVAAATPSPPQTSVLRTTKPAAPLTTQRGFATPRAAAIGAIAASLGWVILASARRRTLRVVMR